MSDDIWFTSDLHLGHVNINRLAGRPFVSVDAADQFMIDEWNARVADDDTVWVLGDLCMGKFTDSLQRAAELRGHKVLVPGNHDRVSSLYHGSPERKAEWRAAYEAAGFRIADEQIADFPLDFFTENADLVDVCHFPYHGDSHGEDRYTDARPADRGRVLLHGHVHEAWRINGRQVNVGVDVWDFAPVHARTLVELIREHV